MATSERSLLQAAYQETRELVTFSSRELGNQSVDGEKPLYVTTFLGASQIKWALVDTYASTNILPFLTLDALGIHKKESPESNFKWQG